VHRGQDFLGDVLGLDEVLTADHDGACDEPFRGFAACAALQHLTQELACVARRDLGHVFRRPLGNELAAAGTALGEHNIACAVARATRFRFAAAGARSLCVMAPGLGSGFNDIAVTGCRPTASYLAVTTTAVPS
jgi:hypothetical protein